MAAPSVSGILFTAILPLILTAFFVSPATADTLGACVKNNSGNIKMADSAAECKNNEYFISWNDQGPIGLTGPAGADGNDGVDGQDGAPGATGPQGPIGMTGPAGSDGNDGVDGQDGAPGATGPQGPAGLAGTDGTNGVDGQDGLACWDLNGDGLQDTAEDINNDGLFSALDCAGPQGVAGATGAQGPQGDTGPAGTDGAIGPQGPVGMTGPAGSDGNDGVDGQDGAPGATGPQGPIGLTGPAGPRGPAGSDGGGSLILVSETSIEEDSNFFPNAPSSRAAEFVICPVVPGFESIAISGGCSVREFSGGANGWTLNQNSKFLNGWSCWAQCNGIDGCNGLIIGAQVNCILE